jgi:hypothetical protein
MQKFLPMLFLSLILNQGKAQLAIDTSYSLDSLALSVFLGENVSINNIQFTGQPSQIGQFSIQGVQQPDMVSGIVMSTGNITGIAGPNDQQGYSVSFQGSGDSIISSITGYPSFDAASFEFDFIPSFDSIMFRYVFGSEEYSEFVNSGFNDAFGHFISGPGITGYQNMAVIPDTNLLVSINTLNAQTYPQYYVFNEDTNSSSFPYIQWDGFTTTLVSSLIVQPGLTYHMKIVVADTYDSVYDSGLLLQSQSFRSLPSSSFVGKTELYAKPVQFKISASSTKLNIHFNSDFANHGHLSILNDLGQNLFNKDISVNKGKNNMEILHSLPAGIYIGYLQLGNQTVQIKFIQPE